MVVTAVFLLLRYLKGGITAVPQFLKSRYDKVQKRLLQAYFGSIPKVVEQIKIIELCIKVLCLQIIYCP
jgi:uncharacterized sodium:solute symporter family permease YidK